MSFILKVAQLLPGKVKYRYMNLVETPDYEYEETLLREIDDSQVKCILVLEHFTFQKAQVIKKMLSKLKY
jgi:hypothetical protein